MGGGVARPNPFLYGLTNAPPYRRNEIVVDASDNVATRYLVSDVCLLLGKVLVSASAVRMEGQVCVDVSVYGYRYVCVPVFPSCICMCVSAQSWSQLASHGWSSL